jgi:cyclomaltodextrinase / maltogenic alpha-amylase / neopullulanase
MPRQKEPLTEKAPLTRRGFLRLSVIAAGSAMAAACQKRLIDSIGTSTVAPSPAPAVKLSLSGGNQDVWTWEKQMQVRVLEGNCERMVVRVNGQEFEAQPEGQDFIAEVPLSPGENEVSAVCLLPTGEEFPSEPVIYTARLRQAPTAMIQIRLVDGKLILNGSQSVPAEAAGSPIVNYFWSARLDNPARLQLQDGDLRDEVSGESISILPPTVDGEYYVSLRVMDEAGREDTSTIYFVVENGQPRIPDYDTENPAWVEKAIVYGVLPFLFARPAFHAIRERLDDLADLGINSLWLAPINVHPADDSGWSVEDHFGLEPDYGTAEDFRALVQAAHQRGIRVLMDFVPNHSSNTHPYFRDAEERGQDSPYWDFYNRDTSGNPTHSLPDWTHLPDFNYDNPEVQRMMIEAFSYWVRDFDVDGFRVDAAWAIRERRPDFWLPWRRELKRIKPDLLLLAEATAREPYYFDNGFDAAYDWTYHVGGWAWGAVWNTESSRDYRLLAYNMTDALNNRPEGFHPDALIFRFINNNDTGKRFITRHGEGVTKVATAMLLTLPGIPCIYTGDEYGLEFEPYQRLEPLTFEEQYPGLRDYHKKLIALRKAHPSLHSRQMTLIKPDPVPQTVFSYIRYDEAPEAPVLVLLNFSEEPAEFQFDIPAEFGAPEGPELYDLLAEENVPAVAGERIQVSVPGQSARLLAHAPVQ